MAGNQYRELFGSFQYVALATRPNITCAVSKLAQFLANPSPVHLDVALRVLRYLNVTVKWTLNLGGDISDLAGFSDSDCAGYRDDRRSIGAHLSRMGDGGIGKRRNRHQSHSRRRKRSIWWPRRKSSRLRNFWRVLGSTRRHLWSSTATTREPSHSYRTAFHPHSKHIDIQYHFTRELVQPGRIIVKYIHTKTMIAYSQLAPHYCYTS